LKFWLVRIGSILLALGAVFLLDVVSQGTSDFSQRLIVLAGLYITLSVSLNLINGITGQFSIGHAAFYQVGAYTAGYLTVTFYGKLGGIVGIPWLILMMLVGGVSAGVAGFIVGLPSLRLKGDYLAIVTLGFGEIIRIIVQNQTILGGSYGFNVQPKFASLFGSTGTTGVWLVWLLAILTIAVCRNLLKTSHGLPFLAVREDEIASSAMGVNVTNVKVIAFVMGSMFAGAAGVLLAHFEGFISPQTFSMDLSFIVLTMVVLGGTGSITGSVLAAAALFYLPEKLRDLPPIPAPLLCGAVIASIGMVVMMKRISDKYSGPKLKAVGLYFGAVFAAVFFAYLLGFAFAMFPTIANAVPIEASKLRMVIFAATLVSLMLLRPQGVLGHYELSLDWILRRKQKQEVSA
jgi:branched-chain amino acid transport system permease protein